MHSFVLLKNVVQSKINMIMVLKNYREIIFISLNLIKGGFVSSSHSEEALRPVGLNGKYLVCASTASISSGR